MFAANIVGFWAVASRARPACGCLRCLVNHIGRLTFLARFAEAPPPKRTILAVRYRRARRIFDALLPGGAPEHVTGRRPGSVVPVDWRVGAEAGFADAGWRIGGARALFAAGPFGVWSHPRGSGLARQPVSPEFFFLALRTLQRVLAVLASLQPKIPIGS